MIDLRMTLAGARGRHCLRLPRPAAAQTKWNLPAAYPIDNPHTVNLTTFAKDVADATGGKLQITVHAAASLFKAPEIKRAVADRPGADRRGADLDPRERGSDLRHRRHPVPRDQLSGSRKQAVGGDASRRSRRSSRRRA